MIEAQSNGQTSRWYTDDYRGAYEAVFERIYEDPVKLSLLYLLLSSKDVLEGGELSFFCECG